MNNEEILKAVNIIGYDKNKHKTLKEALSNFLGNEIYNDVMRGIVINEDDYNTVQTALQYYKDLKQIDINYINQLIDEEQNKKCEGEFFNQKENTETVESLIFNYGGKSILKVKNNITKQYETILEAKNIESHKYYFTTDDSIYNLIGKKLFGDYKSFKTITDKIIEVTTTNNATIYMSTNGIDIIKKSKYSNYYNNIIKIFSSSETNFTYLNQFFNLLISGKKLKYLEYDICSVVDQYIYCKKKNEVAYFKINGDKIITTEDCIYSYISDLGFSEREKEFLKNIDKNSKTKSDERNHVITVGKYDDKFNLKCGLYDLDLNKEILKPCYKNLTRIQGCISIGYDDNNNKYLVVRNDSGMIKCYEFESQLRNIKLSDSVIRTFDCIKLDDNSCAVIINSCFDNLFVINNIFSSPTIVNNFKMLNYFKILDYYYIKQIKSLVFTVKKLNESNVYDDRFIVDGNGNFANLNLKYVMEHLDNSGEDYNHNSYLSLPESVQKSKYLLPVYQEKTNILICLNERKRTKIIKKELSSLANVSMDDNLQKKLVNANQDLDYNNHRCYLGILKQSDNGNYLIAKEKEHFFGPRTKPFLINLSNKKIINNQNYDIISIDTLDNYVIELPFGNGKKQCLLNNQGEVLINYADKIEGPVEGIYIVTNRDVKQCYLNGAPISYSAEQVDIIDKYICESNGHFIDIKKELAFGNMGNYSITDCDSDKVLIESDNILKLKQLLDDDLICHSEEANQDDEKRRIFKK